MPWEMAQRAKTHRRWSEKFTGPIQHTALMAMKLWENKEALGQYFNHIAINDSAQNSHRKLFTETTAFLVYLDVEEYVESDKERKIIFLRTIKEARCVPMTRVHAMYDDLFALTQASAIESGGSISGYDALEHAIAPRPGLLRIAIIDECPFRIRTPFFNMLPTEFNEKASDFAHSELPQDSDYLNVLKEQVALDDNSWKPPARQEACHRWIEKVQSHFIDASIHALNLRKQPNYTGRYNVSYYSELCSNSQLDTHVVVIDINCREEVISAVRRLSNFVHSVRKAYAIPADEVDEKYAMALESFNSAPPLKTGERYLRMLVVDDDSEGNNYLFIAPSLYTIHPGRLIPSFDPEWLSILKENVQS